VTYGDDGDGDGLVDNNNALTTMASALKTCILLAFSRQTSIRQRQDCQFHQGAAFVCSLPLLDPIIQSHAAAAAAVT
jgi:hypothetical protein